MRFLIVLLCFLGGHVGHGQKTTVHGRVFDALTEDPLPYVTVTFDKLKVGTRTDIDGFFLLETDAGMPRSIRCSYVGYDVQIIEIQPNVHNEVTIRLSENSAKIQEVTIRPKKYSKKDNPAVDLIDQVFKNKDRNRKEALDFYSFEKYEKLQLDLNNITDNFRNRWYFKPFRFIFDHVDTNKVTQKVALPMYLRERLVQLNYRKEPAPIQKALLRGERQTGFHDDAQDLDLDEEGVSAFVNSMYPDVDIYDSKIMLLGTQFVGPLSGIAHSMYRFYILDTILLDGKPYADVFFSPKNKADLAFMGNLLVALDSTYAVIKVEMGLPKEVNLNFVSDMHIEQEFARVPCQRDTHLMLVKDCITMDFNILKKSKGRSLIARKTSSYAHFSLNQLLPDSLFVRPDVLVEKDTGNLRRRPKIWWAALRHDTLSRPEANIEGMVDSIQRTRIFRNLKTIGAVLGTGFYRWGGVDIGQVNSFYSFNDIEGTRLRLRARTNRRLVKPMILDGYLAYGFRDERWKYRLSGTWSFTGDRPNRFPMNQVQMSFQRDLRIPGLSLDNLSPDNFLTSYQRAPNNRFFMNESLRLEYQREYKNQLSFHVLAERRLHSSVGNLAFDYGLPGSDETFSKTTLATAEVGLQIRYSPNQQFYQGANYRLRVPNRFPIFSISFKNGLRTPQWFSPSGVPVGEFAFQKLTALVEKNFYIAPLGTSEVRFTAGRIFGSLPYPLLEIHPANQTYIYDWYSFNLMNFMEFVSDRYASIVWHHDFRGFFFNKIPLLKKLQLREAGSLKVLWGGLAEKNIPTPQNGLFFFPKDDIGNPIVHHLGSQPYIEASVGIGNIFKFLRVDYVWRINYRDLPNVTNWGVRFVFRGGI